MEPSADNNPQPNTSASPDTSEPTPVAPSEPESAAPEEPASEPLPETTPAPEPVIADEASEEPSETSEPSEPDTPIVSSETEEPAEPVASPETSQAEAQQDAKAPKSKKSLVAIIIILIIVLLSCGGCLAWFMLNNNSNPSNNGQSSNNNSSNGNQSSNNTTPTYDLGKISDFDLAFLRLENAGGNVVYSPLSIKYALAMLSEAAAGDSKTQITNLIGDYQPTNYTNNAHRSFANAMFIRDAAAEFILGTYTTTLEQKYNASVIYDPFTSAAPINNWVSSKTNGIIKNILEDDALEEADFALVNALAIDMNWKNQLQCGTSPKDDSVKVPCKFYYVRPAHENYFEWIDYIADDKYQEIEFNGNKVKSAVIGTTANRYNIIEELGEEYIRSTVQTAHEEFMIEQGIEEDPDFDMDEYMKSLSENYGKVYNSTDFYFNETDNEKVFAKDLQEYDGSTLQYVGIMPKNEDLSTYTNALTVDKLTNLIGNVKNVADINSFKEGVVTKIIGNIPLFNLDYELKLKEDLEKLGIKDVFDGDLANLSNLTTIEGSYIHDAFHKTNIDFSNDGIKAAAATVLSGGLGAAYAFDYRWDVPTEEIDITFDKPFFFIIRDKATGEVWFTGTVYNPTA